jgi:hypothetical protein
MTTKVTNLNIDTTTLTSVGTLTSLAVTGNITSGNANLGNLTSSNYFSGSGNLLSNIQGANVSGAVSSSTTAGTVTTAAQGNITSVGSLTGLTVSNATGVVNFTTTANVTLGAVANLHISGGSSGQFLSTDGSGTLTWGSVSASPGTNNIGYQNIPQNSAPFDYTAVLSDSGKHIYHPGTDAVSRTYTIPSNASVAFPVGTTIIFVNDSPGYTVTIICDTDTLMFAGTGATGTRTLAANGIATTIKLTSTKWIISGIGLT